MDMSVTFKPTIMQRTRLLATGHPIHALSASVPRLTFYGGATVTRAHDTTGALFTICCCKDNASGLFGLYAMNGVTPILIRPVSGRGSVWISLFDGTGNWVGFDGSVPPSGGPIPGFAPFPSLPALSAQIAALKNAIVAGSGGGAGHAPVAIPVGGAIDELWDGVYAAKDFDTAAETALRSQKQLDALQEMVELLKRAGVLV